tara:strand:+ start:133 stop:468 length:336 start_codon:yes stop_codon:yes gene_type:complete
LLLLYPFYFFLRESRVHLLISKNHTLNNGSAGYNSNLERISRNAGERLSARWDYICPDSTKGDYPTESIPEEILEEYCKTIQKLIDFPFAEVDGESVMPHIIGLTEEAFEL